jgi:hypothetical protein
MQEEKIMKNLTSQKKIALGTMGALSATLLGGAFIPTPAQADAKTWKKSLSAPALSVLMV